jgi:hypothetical protein
MTKAALNKQTLKIQYAMRIREILDEASTQELDEGEIIELVTEDDPE